MTDLSHICAWKMILTLLLKVSLMSIMLFSTPGEARCTAASDAKWLEKGGKVTVRYTLHKNVEKDRVLKNLIQQAARIFKDQTCVEWTEAKVTDRCHKVIFMKGDTCLATLDPMNRIGVKISLHWKCYRLTIILHEMMHALGIRHTNQRPDRKEYVRIWKPNIEKGLESNFEIDQSIKTYDVPYDYQSIMHYGRLYFSKNNLYTITATDFRAMLAMGTREELLRWSDAAMVNHHLDCIARSSICGERDNPCKNNGYLLYNCTCSCPENTEGKFCEIFFNQTLYDKKVQCGGLIETDDNIYITNMDLQRAPGNLCVFKMEAKQCHQVHVKLRAVYMPGSECSDNVFAYETPVLLKTYCNKSFVPVGMTISFRHKRVAIHYYLGKDFPRNDAGFQAEVTFHRNTTWPRGKEISETIGDCYRTTYGRFYVMRTPYFPSTVSCFAECSETFEFDMDGKETGFMRLELDQRLKGTEELKIEDRNFIWTTTSSSKPSLTMVVQMPVIVKFEGGDDPGEGFEIRMHRGYTSMCDGKTMLVNRSGLVIMNPIYTDNHLISCYIPIKASTGNRLHFNLKGTMDDTVFIGTKQSVRDKDYQFSRYSKSQQNVYVNKHSAVLFYESGEAKKNWKVIVTLQECYFKPDGLCM